MSSVATHCGLRACKKAMRAALTLDSPRRCSFGAGMKAFTSLVARSSSWDGSWNLARYRKTDDGDGTTRRPCFRTNRSRARRSRLVSKRFSARNSSRQKPASLARTFRSSTQSPPVMLRRTIASTIWTSVQPKLPSRARTCWCIAAGRPAAKAISRKMGRPAAAVTVESELSASPRWCRIWVSALSVPCRSNAGQRGSSIFRAVNQGRDFCCFFRRRMYEGRPGTRGTDM